ncbi:MAG: WD40 repeat domain-containing protein [Planctomycetaceae bacterium]|nr:WD40 repeat domain-containing protein [Planctomycetaceae bacterium]
MPKINSPRVRLVNALVLLFLTNCLTGVAASAEFPGIVNSDLSYFELSGHPGTIFSACFIDNQFLASGDHLGNLILWDLKNRRKIKSIKANNSSAPVRQLQHHSGIIYGIGKNGNLVGWDKSDLSEKKVIYLPLETIEFHCLPSEGLVYALDRKRKIWQVKWDTSERKPLNHLECRFIAFVPGNHTCLVTVPTNNTQKRRMAIFDLKKQTVQKELAIEVQSNAHVEVAIDSTQLAFATGLPGPDPIQVFQFKDGANDLVVSPHDSTTALTLSNDGRFLACSGQFARTQQKFDGQRVYSSHSLWKLSSSNRLRLNYVEGTEASFTRKQPNGWGYVCEFSPNDSMLVLGGMDGKLHCFTIKGK